MPNKLKLNSRQRLVLINALSGMNQTDSYAKVYGPNPNSYTLASELYRKPHFKAELERLQNKALAKVEQSIASPSERKQILTELLRARLIDFQDASGQPSLTKDTPHNRAAKEFYHRQRIDRNGNPIVTKSIKLTDPIAAIQELNKMDGSYAPSRHLVAQRVQFEVMLVDRKKELPEGED